jgi:hypothetical protein
MTVKRAVIAGDYEEIYLRLRPPFFISGRTYPALPVGNATLSLMAIKSGPGRRERAYFVLDLPWGLVHEDSPMFSRMGGFKGYVEVFYAYLEFLSAAAESHEYEQRTGKKGENSDLFPPHVVEWAAENKSGIEKARIWICDEDGNPFESLIETEV